MTEPSRLSEARRPVVLVTGAASGLGRAAAVTVAAAGAHVLVADVDEAGGMASADAVGGTFHRLDVAEEAGWKALGHEIGRVHGGLDAAVLAAGLGGPFQTVAEMDLAAWRRVLAVNLDGTMLGLRTSIRLMRKSGGAIVTVASTAGMRGAPWLSAYGASKGGVRLLTRAAAMECARMGLRIRINCIVPGPIDTPLLDRLLQASPLGREATAKVIRDSVPMGRFGRAEEFGAMAAFLVGEGSSFTTGAEVPLDGGMLAG